MPILLKRIYEAPLQQDGFRVLVERLWPRGLSKEKARVDLWLKEAAPSAELRKWFNHDPSKWEEFKTRYFAELDERKSVWEEISKVARKEKVTFVFASKEERVNNAVALREYVKSRRW